MPRRVIKSILPENKSSEALKILDEEDHLGYWLEESSSHNFVVSILAEAEQSEKIMDLFERSFSHVDNFKLILFPVEASLPRVKEESGDKKKEKQAGEKTIVMRISREELHADVSESAQLSSLYLAMVLLSTIVVAIGLMRDSVAVIVGGMVIAPFLGPNVALALSANLADKSLGATATKSLFAGVGLAYGVAVLLGAIFDINAANNEISSRTTATISDVFLALAAGGAGVLAFTSGASSTIIGVMVAVALLPPLVVSGLMLGSSQPIMAGGAFLLFIVNVICINLAGIATFLFQGISPRVWWEAEKAKKMTKVALLLWSSILALLVILLTIEFQVSKI